MAKIYADEYFLCTGYFAIQPMIYVAYNIWKKYLREISVRSYTACIISPRSAATWLMFEPGLRKPHGFLLGTYGNVVC